MQTLTYKKFWHCIGLFAILSTFYISLKQMSGGTPPFPHFDKFCHFTIYSLLAHYHCNLFLKLKKYWVFIFFFAMGIMIEFLQGMTGYRFFELADIIANTLGVLFGQTILLKIFPDYIWRLDRHFT